MDCVNQWVVVFVAGLFVIEITIIAVSLLVVMTIVRREARGGDV